jgi:hypothetical protein
VQFTQGIDNTDTRRAGCGLLFRPSSRNFVGFAYQLVGYFKIETFDTRPQVKIALLP